jgi:hypothetical protein
MELVVRDTNRPDRAAGDRRRDLLLLFPLGPTLMRLCWPNSASATTSPDVRGGNRDRNDPGSECRQHADLHTLGRPCADATPMNAKTTSVAMAARQALFPADSTLNRCGCIVHRPR